MSEKITTATEPLVIKNYARLQKIEKYLEDNDVDQNSTLRKEIKGGAIFFTELTNLDLVSKIDGYLVWNDKIPVTIKLAVTITENCRTRQEAYRDARKAKDQEKYPIEPDHLFNNKFINKLETEQKVKKPVKKAKTSVKKDIEEKAGSFKFVFLWGLLTIEIS